MSEWADPAKRQDTDESLADILTRALKKKSEEVEADPMTALKHEVQEMRLDMALVHGVMEMLREIDNRALARFNKLAKRIERLYWLTIIGFAFVVYAIISSISG